MSAKKAKKENSKKAMAMESVHFTLDSKGIVIEAIGTTYSISSESSITLKRIPFTIFIDKKGNSFTAYDESGRFSPQFIAWSLSMYHECEERISANEIARAWTAETGEKVNPDTLRKALKKHGYKVDPQRSVMGSHGATRRNELYGYPSQQGKAKTKHVTPKDTSGKAKGKEKIVHGDEGRSLDITTSTAKYFFTSRKTISLEKKCTGNK